MKTLVRLTARPLLAAIVLLTVPLVAMGFTEEVAWTLFDFVVAGALVFGTGFTFELALRRTEDTMYRLAAGVALAAAFLLVWVNLAVGIIGSAGNDANLMYGGVLAVGAVGAFLVGFEPLGMARALFATAFAQALVAAIAIFAGLGLPASPPLELMALNGFFVALFVGSGLLFLRAVGERARAGAAMEA